MYKYVPLPKRSPPVPSVGSMPNRGHAYSCPSAFAADICAAMDEIRANQEDILAVIPILDVGTTQGAVVIGSGTSGARPPDPTDGADASS